MSIRFWIGSERAAVIKHLCSGFLARTEFFPILRVVVCVASLIGSPVLLLSRVPSDYEVLTMLITFGVSGSDAARIAALRTLLRADLALRGAPRPLQEVSRANAPTPTHPPTSQRVLFHAPRVTSRLLCHCVRFVRSPTPRAGKHLPQQRLSVKSARASQGTIPVPTPCCPSKDRPETALLPSLTHVCLLPPSPTPRPPLSQSGRLPPALCAAYSRPPYARVRQRCPAVRTRRRYVLPHPRSFCPLLAPPRFPPPRRPPCHLRCRRCCGSGPASCPCGYYPVSRRRHG